MRRDWRCWLELPCPISIHKKQKVQHFLTLVIFVFFIILVRSGCDEGGLLVFVLSRFFILSRGFSMSKVFVSLGVLVSLGVYMSMVA